MKTCTKCKMEKPATPDYFHRDKKLKDGLFSSCKDCKREYKKKYYQENKEYHREYHREYKKKHYQENKEYYREYNKKYYQENKEKYREYNITYHLENPEVFRLKKQRRRARMSELPHDLIEEEWEDALEYFDYSCAYCGVPEDSLHQEHVIPVVKGGGYTADNIIPACQSCNSSKNAKDLEEWYVSYKHYDEERLNEILDYVEIIKGDVNYEKQRAEIL